MLDRKTKDIDASIELLEDRKKLSKIVFFCFFIVGWSTVVISITLLPYKYDELGIGLGIFLLIFATWFFNNWNYHNTLIVLKTTKKPMQKE